MKDEWKTADHYPSISVVMPTYNDGPYLREAIDSILNQTFADFEFIIVNDGSTDDTEDIINSYADRRIRYLKNEQNLGNTISRNLGMKAARGKYIAIMDSDDISVLDRFEIQYKYLEKHPEIGILGGANVFYEGNSWFCRYYPFDPEYIKSFLFFKNPIVQPAVMLKAELVNLEEDGLMYNPEFDTGGDFDFWYRAIMTGMKISNLKKILLYYRISENQMSSPMNLGQRERNLDVYFRQKLAMFGIETNETDFHILHDFIKGRIRISESDFEIINKYLFSIELANLKKKVFNDMAVKAVLFGMRLRLIKYQYLEKGEKFRFTIAFLRLVKVTGLRSILQFWNNEGRYLKKKIHNGKFWQ